MPRDYELVVHRPAAARTKSSRIERTLAKRILMVVTRRTRAACTAAALSAAKMARESGGAVRLMYISPLPPPRVDGHDRVVADTDREMARIAGLASERLTALAAEMDGVPVEQAVRFGRLGAELSIEVEVFGADLVVLAARARPHLRHRLRAWSLERIALASRVPVIVLPSPATAARGRSLLRRHRFSMTHAGPCGIQGAAHETQRRANLDHSHGEPAAPG